MKKLFTLIALIMIGNAAFAQFQDTILTQNREKIPCKIIYISERIVVYQGADGVEKYMPRGAVKYNWVGNGSKVDKFERGIQPYQVHYPQNQLRVGAEYQAKGANNILTAVGLSVCGSVVAIVGGLLVDSSTGVIAVSAIGGGIALIGLTVGINGVVQLKKAASHYEHYTPPAPALVQQE